LRCRPRLVYLSPWPSLEAQPIGLSDALRPFLGAAWRAREGTALLAVTASFLSGYPTSRSASRDTVRSASHQPAQPRRPSTIAVFRSPVALQWRGVAPAAPIPYSGWMGGNGDAGHGERNLPQLEWGSVVFGPRARVRPWVCSTSTKPSVGRAIIVDGC
jgi:hypothetical protein